MSKTYTYHQFIDKFLPNRKCPKCKKDVPIRREIRGEYWLICPSCDFVKYDGYPMFERREAKDE